MSLKTDKKAFKKRLLCFCVALVCLITAVVPCVSAEESLDEMQNRYEELEKDGFIYTVSGKGCFVAEGNQELLRENQLCHIEDLLAKAASQAEALGVTRDKLHEMLDLVAPETMQ